MTDNSSLLAWACTALAVAVLVMAVACAVLCCSVPYLFRRVLRQEGRLRSLRKDVDDMDGTLSDLSALAIRRTGVEGGYDGRALTPSNGWAPSELAGGRGAMNDVTERNGGPPLGVPDWKYPNGPPG